MNESVEEAALSVYMLHSNDKFWGIENIWLLDLWGLFDC